MTRSLKKGIFVDPKILKKLQKIKPEDKIPIRTWSRDTMITPEMIGYIFEVYNGKNFVKVEVKEEMVGHRLGEFAPTRKFIKHGGRMQRELEAKMKAQESQNNVQK